MIDYNMIRRGVNPANPFSAIMRGQDRARRTRIDEQTIAENQMKLDAMRQAKENAEMQERENQLANQTLRDLIQGKGLDESGLPTDFSDDPREQARLLASMENGGPMNAAEAIQALMATDPERAMALRKQFALLNLGKGRAIDTLTGEYLEPPSAGDSSLDMDAVKSGNMIDAILNSNLTQQEKFAAIQKEKDRLTRERTGLANARAKGTANRMQDLRLQQLLRKETEAEKGVPIEKQKRDLPPPVKNFFIGGNDGNYQLSKGDLKDIKGGTSLYANTMGNIKDLQSQLEELGRFTSGKIPTEKAQRFQSQLYHTLMNAKEKDGYNLGVLTGPDLDILLKIIGDPENGWNVLKPENIKAKIDTYFKNSRMRYITKLNTMGFDINSDNINDFENSISKTFAYKNAPKYGKIKSIPKSNAEKAIKEKIPEIQRKTRKDLLSELEELEANK